MSNCQNLNNTKESVHLNSHYSYDKDRNSTDSIHQPERKIKNHKNIFPPIWNQVMWLSEKQIWATWALYKKGWLAQQQRVMVGFKVLMLRDREIKSLWDWYELGSEVSFMKIVSVFCQFSIHCSSNLCYLPLPQSSVNCLSKQYSSLHNKRHVSTYLYRWDILLVKCQLMHTCKSQGVFPATVAVTYTCFILGKPCSFFLQRFQTKIGWLVGWFLCLMEYQPL